MYTSLPRALFLALLTCTTALALAVGHGAQIAFVNTDGSSVSDCGAPDDVFHLESITVTPDPPQRGQLLTVDVKGHLDEAIDVGATVDVRVKLGLIKLLDKTFDLCEEIKQIGRECPLEKGPIHVNHTVELPRELPPGRYQVFIEATNFDEKHAACIKADFRLSL
ncbi:ML domain-containing protein [Phlyctochytrium arcticum]|nr:ML domain-containing protein [Phlyctochytrium arcticum]